MPSFSYSAINSQGSTLAGEIQATDLAAARDALRGQGLLAQFIEERKGASAESDAKSGMFGRVKKPKPKALQIFSRQFATMIEAGLSVVSALVILEAQTEDEALTAIIIERPRGGRGRRPALRGDGASTPRPSTACTSRWSRPARPPVCSTSCSTASRARSRRRRRSSAA